MILYWKTILPLIGILLAAPTVSVHAQTATPPAQPTGEVTGVIVNLSENGQVPDSLEVMLHIWDENFTERGMLHGESGPGGRFRFEEVPLEEGLFYAVMANYDEVSYFSEPIPADGTAEVLNVTVPIYETTADLSQAGVDQMHVFFTPHQGGLGVTEIYVLSNQGNATVRQALTLEDGTPATLKFTLPTGAANVSFRSDSGDRFVRFPGGFADTAPLVPGIANSQIVVGYVLPYSDGMILRFAPPLATRQVGFLVTQGVGLTLEGESLTSEGLMTLSEGLVVEVFTHDSLPAGESLQVTLSGELRPASVEAANSVEAAETGSGRMPATWKENSGVAIGATLLGLAFVIVGAWWWRRPADRADETEPEDADFEVIVSEIVDLDDAFSSGQLDEEVYQNRRTELLHRTRRLDGEEGDARP